MSAGRQGTRAVPTPGGGPGDPGHSPGEHAAVLGRTRCTGGCQYPAPPGEHAQGQGTRHLERAGPEGRDRDRRRVGVRAPRSGRVPPRRTARPGAVAAAPPGGTPAPAATGPGRPGPAGTPGGPAAAGWTRGGGATGPTPTGTAGPRTGRRRTRPRRPGSPAARSNSINRCEWTNDADSGTAAASIFLFRSANCPRHLARVGSTSRMLWSASICACRTGRIGLALPPPAGVRRYPSQTPSST